MAEEVQEVYDPVPDLDVMEGVVQTTNFEELLPSVEADADIDVH